MPRFGRLDLHGTFSGGVQATAAASKRGGVFGEVQQRDDFSHPLEITRPGKHTKSY